LYADDDGDIRQIVQLALSLTAGMTLHTAESGEQALKLARRLLPDLVLLDVMMPGLDGPSTLKLMRNDSAIAHIPVIFITAKAMPREVALFHKIGAIGVIAKPFDPVNLYKQVHSLWQGCPAASRAMPPRDVEERLRLRALQLGEIFLQRTQAETVVLRELIEDARRGNTAVVDQLVRMVHKIRGTGATFGFAAVSECAGKIEHLLEGLKGFASSAEAVAKPQLLQQLIECIQGLMREVEAAAVR
jgi:two-component system OmpR family response regulator